MDVYGLPTPDGLGIGIDDFLDFSNDEIFTASTSTGTTITTTDSDGFHHFPYFEKNSAGSASSFDTLNPDYSSTDFTDDLGVPNDDVAELEWLSNFVDDSSSEFPANSITGTMNVHSETPLNSRSRSKRFRSTQWTSSYESATIPCWKTDSKNSNSRKKEQNSMSVSSSRERSASSSMETLPRKCTHCASEKTPQWRTGPLGPKSLCNACGVRYKSGRLVPEYRPAASPTFMLTQHSNSHRKVLELRRQKELLRQQQQQQQQHQELYGHQHRHFQVC